jgi:hypothetical protein
LGSPSILDWFREGMGYKSVVQRIFPWVAFSTSEEPYIQNVVLDADWDLEKEIDDSRALCLDGTFLGNVARYINHRC